jgi:CubicO group peptidase (beta-lactamase class C family)
MLVAFTHGSTYVPAQEQPAITRRVDALFAQWDKPESPGCALGVIKDGKLIYARGYGMANLEHAVPITSATVFDIGSTSKQFTAACIEILAQRGKLAIDDDIRKFLPELPEYGKKITIRHLLNHTSGIRDYLGLMSMSGINFDDQTDDDDALRIIARQKALNFPPGEEHLYSNSGYFLLSIIVKRASGKSLRAFAEENIFAPLGMTHTHYHDAHTMIVAKRATGYSPGPAGGFRIEMSNFEQTGDGGVYTTVEDLLRWDQNFYDAKVGGRAMYDQLLTVGVLNNGKKLTYAQGLMIDEYKGLKVISHGGAWAGYRAELVRFPDQHFSVICLSNLGSFNPSRLARQVAEIYLADQMKSDSPTAEKKSVTSVVLSQFELRAMSGTYRDANSGVTLKVSPAGAGLRIDYSGMLTFEASPVSKTRFRSTNAPVEITLDFDLRAGAEKLIAMVETQDPTTFNRVQPVKLSPSQLAEYAGTYYSDELDVIYTLSADGEALVAAIGLRGVKRKFSPGIADVFSGQGVELIFARESNRISGFNLNAGRVKGIRFVRK